MVRTCFSQVLVFIVSSEFQTISFVYHLNVGITIPLKIIL